MITLSVTLVASVHTADRAPSFVIAMKDILVLHVVRVRIYQTSHLPNPKIFMFAVVRSKSVHAEHAILSPFLPGDFDSDYPIMK